VHGPHEPRAFAIDRQRDVAHRVRSTHDGVTAVFGARCHRGARDRNSVGEQLNGQKLARPDQRGITSRLRTLARRSSALI
jgi:hypothetical protein